MRRIHIISIISVILLSTSAIQAQSLFDLPLFGQQGPRQQDKSVKFEYGADFQYYMDFRGMSISDDLFMSSETFNVARLSPSAGLSFEQGRNTRHRLMAGIDLVKNLGEYPIELVLYSTGEDDPKLNNLALFKEIFYYYNMQSRLGDGLLSLYAGIFPRSCLDGDYSRVHFSDEFKVSDVNLEGALVSYRTHRLYAELAVDRMGKTGVDRRERMMAVTAGSYRLFDWASIGWSGTYMFCGESYLEPYDVHNAVLNPYLKFEFGQALKMDELSLKAGAIASFQKDMEYHNLGAEYDDAPHFPLGVEAVLTARKWGFGIENTFFYGDNMMPFRADSYVSKTGVFNHLLYTGDPFYFTHRGFAAGYDRAEVFYQPHVADFLDIRLSGVAHFIMPVSDVYGTFMGWQAQASLYFSLEDLLNPKKTPSARQSRKQSKVPHGPSIVL